MSTIGVCSTFPKTLPAEHAAISEGESMEFNALLTDMHPYVADDIFAATEGQFSKRLVAGAFVFSDGLGLLATNCINAFSYGYDKLRFIRPTYIGDTMYTSRPNLEKRPKYRKLGLCWASYKVFKAKREQCSIASMSRFGSTGSQRILWGW